MRRFASSISRFPGFKKLDMDDISYFKFALQPASIVSADLGASIDELESYNTDWMRKYRGQSRLVLKPRSTKEVSQILKYCNDQRLAVVPQGGNTGLVGGGVPVHDEIIVSTQYLNQIRKFDEISGAIVCEAGCILESLDDYLAQRGFMMPLDLGAKGSCHIGGNLATNAGGLRLLRYGSLHGSVLGLEVVLPDGTVLNDLKTLRKDNTGYDLKQLFIGSEGTLGLITAASILTPPRPKSVNVALLAVDSFDAVQQAFIKSKQSLTEILSAFEFFDRGSLDLVMRHLSHCRFPLEQPADFHVLIETSGSNAAHDEEKLQSFLEDLLETGVINDGVVAQDATQAQSIWALREGIPEACSKSGSVYKYDVSMPVPLLYQLVQDMRQRLTNLNLYDQSAESPVTAVVGYGHVGDGNLHLNISARNYDARVTEAIEPFVYEWIQRVGGSISAEHGLGVMKRDYIGYSKSETLVREMGKVKQLFDPRGILNPYKYL